VAYDFTVLVDLVGSTIFYDYTTLIVLIPQFAIQGCDFNTLGPYCSTPVYVLVQTLLAAVVVLDS
jgi:hypothetical protein